MHFNIRCLILAGIFSAGLVQAQLPTINPFLLDSDAKTDIAIFDVKTPGTYYYDGNWNTGHIHLKGGDSLVGYYIRYDLVRNQIEFIWGTRKVGIYGTNIDSFLWYSPIHQQEQLFISKNQFTFSKPENVAGFLEVLVDGEVRLLKSKTIIARYQATSPSLIPDDQSADNNNFIDDYYLVKGENVFKVSRRKKILEYLSSEKVSDYLKTEKLNVSSEEDLIKIIQYYNQHCIDS